MPQAPSLYRELTVDEHMRAGGDASPGFDPAIARRRLDDLDIPLDVARRRAVRRASRPRSGWRSRSATRAPVLLLDEPLASLDPLARREFLHVLVDAVRADGATALLSSHVITDIEQACDRLLVLGGGTDAARPVDRWGHRRAPGHRRDRWPGLRATRRRSSGRSQAPPESS